MSLTRSDLEERRWQQVILQSGRKLTGKEFASVVVDFMEAMPRLYSVQLTEIAPF